MNHVVDVNDWENFKIGELFEVSRPVARSFMKYEEGDIPFVASGNFDNGVVGYRRPKNSDDFDAGMCITVSPLDGSAFFQKEPFLGRGGAGSAILILRNENLTEMNGLFIATVIKNTLTKYSYSNQINSKTIKEEVIKLPVTLPDHPDWSYMDSYMSGIMDESRDVAEGLSAMKFAKTKMDVSMWKEFEMRLGLGFDVFHGRRLNKANRVDGEVPFVTAGHENRGVKQYIATDRTRYKDPITVDMFGNCFYHPYECCGDDNVYFFVSDKISNLSKMFISTSINVRTRYIYNYKEQFRQRDANSLTVTLPVTESGDPDWEYMDSYMSKIMNESQVRVDNLEQLLK
ncbi:restriction endonuclease subunit S [Rothia mucilaginosa]